MYDRLTLTDTDTGTSQTFSLTPIAVPPPPPVTWKISRPIPGVPLDFSQLEERTKVFFERGKTYIVKDQTIRARGVLLLADGSGPDPVLFFPGDGHGHYMLTVEGAACSIVGLAFQSELADDSKRAGAIQVKGDELLIDSCTFANVDTAILCEGKARNLKVLGCHDTTNTSIAGYFLWFAGINGLVKGNTIANSIYQHIVRASADADGLEISDNTFTNLDRRGVPGGNTGDYSKGCVTLQTIKNVKILKNTFKLGAVTTGPLANVNADGSLWAGESIEERTANVEIRENTFIDADLIVHHGSTNVLIDSNNFTRITGPCISIDGWDETFKRGVEQLTINNNKAVITGDLANFVRAWGKVSKVTVTGNTVAAPALAVGDGGSAPVNVGEPDLTNWTFASNKWPKPAKYGWLARNQHLEGQYGINHVGLDESEPTWKGPAAWQFLPQVKGDVFG